MTRNKDTLAIVYQFGKVASTTLVNTLNKCEGVEAHQSHFLGNHALQRVIPNLTSIETNDYFRGHLAGQLAKNIELTHRVNQTLAGCRGQRLLMLTPVRDPLDWFRSCIQQDIDGYKNDLEQFALEHKYKPSIENGLDVTLQNILKIVEHYGSAQNTIDQLNIGSPSMRLAECKHLKNLFLRRMLLLSLRPLTWFDDHFSKFLQISLKEFQKSQNFWIYENGRSNFVIIRYEDLETSIFEALEYCEINIKRERLSRFNESKTKSFSKDINKVFSKYHAKRLSILFSDSHYANRFGY